jgi:hypothetical protein
MKKKRAILILVAALLLPLPSSAAAMEDMFAVMFRMMLVMMNVMSDAMLGNSNASDFGSANSFDFGMGGWPAMNGLYGMNPVTGVGSYPGMSPWSGLGGFPGNATGMSPWSGLGGFPGNATGMSPWSAPMSPNTWANPFAPDYSPYGNGPGYGAAPGGVPSRPVSLLEGRWYGQSGEVLEIRGERFRLSHGKYGITGVIRIENNIVNLYSQQTGTVTQYTFMRNQTELLLQDASGMLLNFSKRPGNGMSRRF